MRRVLTLIFAVLIFLVPSNLFLILSTENAYIRGILVDYLIPKLYLSDIFLVLFVGLSVFIGGFSVVKIMQISTVRIKNILSWILLILVGTILVLQVTVPNIPAVLFYTIQLLKIVLLAICLKKSTFIYESASILTAFIGTVLFQSSLAMYQFLTQQSLLGYRFLGEPELNFSLGLAREQVWGTEQLLPYGTTAHPNVLGGILSAYLIVLCSQFGTAHTKVWWYQILYYLALIMGSLALWATHSISAWIAFGIGFLIVLATNKKTREVAATWVIGSFVVASLVAPILLARYANTQAYFPSTSIDRRVTLQVAAIEMMKKNPIAGVGLNQFTNELEKYVPAREVIRFIQPAHSVLLLWVAETGLLGFLLLTAVTLLAWQKSLKLPTYVLLFVPIAVLDHYLITLQSGLLLIVISTMYFQYFSAEK